MRCKLIRAMRQHNPEYNHREHLTAKRAGKPYDVPLDREVPIDHLIEHPDAWRLVLRGVAVPDDDECRQAAGIDDAEIQRRAKIYELEEQGRLVSAKTGDTSFDRPRASRRKPAPAAPAAAAES